MDAVLSSSSYLTTPRDLAPGLYYRPRHQATKPRPPSFRNQAARTADDRSPVPTPPAPSIHGDPSGRSFVPPSQRKTAPNYDDVVIATKRPTSTSQPPVPSIPFALCNALDAFINNVIDPAAHRPNVDPRHVLAGNFAPVGELPPTPCPVVRGRIPRALAGGAYIRNGSNPQHLPRGPHHLFDGDGMLHALLLSPSSSDDDDGAGAPAATFCSRYVRTYKYLLERDAGGPVVPSFFCGFQGIGGLARGVAAAARLLTGQMNPLEGIGLANTSLAYFGGRLFALGEPDLPYEVHLSPLSGDVATVGRWDSDGRLSMGMTAHPKKDPRTGEMFAFRYGLLPPYLTYFRFDAEGNKQPDVPIFSVRETTFLHDFAVTENYAVFCDIQVVMQPIQKIFAGGSLFGPDAGKVPRVGLLPRYASSDAGMKWFDVPGFNPMHVHNAWEEDGGATVVLVATNVLSVQEVLDGMELFRSCVEMARIDTRTGAVSRTPLAAGVLEMGVINPSYQGRRNRYAYVGVADPLPKMGGVVKLDYQLGRTMGISGDCVVASRMYGPGRYGGEPLFVAAPDEGTEEDDGYLVTYLHDENTGESSFLVMDARSPGLEVVAEVALPRRVPYGFHGLFLSKAEVQGQRPSVI